MGAVVQPHAHQLAGSVHHIGIYRLFHKGQALILSDPAQFLRPVAADHRIHILHKAGGGGVDQAPSGLYGEMGLPIHGYIAKLHFLTSQIFEVIIYHPPAAFKTVLRNSPHSSTSLKRST